MIATTIINSIRVKPFWMERFMETPFESRRWKDRHVICRDRAMESDGKCEIDRLD